MTISRSDINSRLWEIANTDANGNITGITVSNAVTAASFTGNGSNLSNITGANVTGTVANANTASYLNGSLSSQLQANGHNIVGGPYDAAQLDLSLGATLSAVRELAGLGGGVQIKTGASTTPTNTWTFTYGGNLVLPGNTFAVNYANGSPVTISGGNAANAANANYANFAGTAYSVAGANVSGAVANATYAISAGSANSVAGANVSGIVANADYSNFSLLAGSINGGTAGALVVQNGSGATGFVTIASAGTVLVSNGTAPTWTLPANVTVGRANIANTANAVAGANVTGEVANATYATTAGIANAVAGANVSGTVANATYATTAGIANAVAGANVSGEVANAAFATLAATANSVDGANVGGTVANAAYATSSNTANTAGTVTTAAQPNITSVGTLSSATVTGNVSAGNANLGNLATANFFTGTLTTAAQPNITSVGTLSNLTSNGTINFTNASNVSLGNAANLRITGGSNGFSLLTNGSGTVTWTAPKKYQREWHIDPANGVDDTLAGSYDRPFLTLAYALTRVGNTGEILYLHAGTYTDNVTITQLNLDVVGTGATTGGIINVTGNVDVASASSSVRMWGINFGNLTHSGASTFYLKNSSVGGELSLTSSSAKYFTEVVSQTGGVSITGAASVSFDGGYLAGVTVNNASATVSIANSGSVAVVTLTAGVLLINNCNIYAVDAVSSAITSASGSFAYIYNSRVIGGGVTGRLALSGFWSINNTVYDRTNSTLSASNLGTISYSDALNVTGNLSVGSLSNLGGVGNVTITGGSNGQFLRTNGSGNLSWATISSSVLSNGNSNVTVTANGNVTTFVAGNANARMTVTSTGANIAGTANITGDITSNGNITISGTVTATGNGNSSGFLVGNGAVSNVALGYMPTAGTAANMAIRDYSTVATAMFFDAGMGGNSTNSSFVFRGSNAYTQYATINQYGITQPTRPAFRVWGNGSQLISPNNLVVNANVDYNQGNHYVNSTGTFTAPVAGLYQVFLNARAGSTASLSQIAVLKNNTYSGSNVVCFWEITTSATQTVHFGVSSVTRLAVGDTLVARCLSGTVTFDTNNNWGAAFIG